MEVAMAPKRTHRPSSGLAWLGDRGEESSRTRAKSVPSSLENANDLKETGNATYDYWHRYRMSYECNGDGNRLQSWLDRNHKPMVAGNAKRRFNSHRLHDRQEHGHDTGSPNRFGGSVDAANQFELHLTVMENGISKMRELHDIEIKPGQTIEFKPGGSHAMFVNLKRPLNKGERVIGTLVFERAAKVQIE